MSETDKAPETTDPNAMIPKSDNAETFKAYKTELETAIPYAWTWTVYPNAATAKAAGDWLSDEEIVDRVNKRRENKARQASLVAALKAAGYEKPTAENDPQVALADMFKMLKKAKLPDGSPRYSETQARETASAMLGYEWDND